MLQVPLKINLFSKNPSETFFFWHAHVIIWKGKRTLGLYSPHASVLSLNPANMTELAALFNPTSWAPCRPRLRGCGTVLQLHGVRQTEALAAQGAHRVVPARCRRRWAPAFHPSGPFLCSAALPRRADSSGINMSWVQFSAFPVDAPRDH